MQSEEKKTQPGEEVSKDKRESQPQKLLKSAIEKYPFKIKKKMSNKEVISKIGIR